MGSFASTSAGHSTKITSVQKKEDQENYVQREGFSDPKITGGEESLQKMHSTVQAKLNIGKPGDKFEKEADETAEKVMTMPDVQRVHAGGDENSVQKKSAGNTDAPDVEKKEDDVKPKVEENTISKKSFLQTALYNEEPDVKNDFINAKHDFPKVPEIKAPKAPEKLKKKETKKAGAKAPGKGGKKAKSADPLKVPVEIPPLKKKKQTAKKKKPKIQKKEEDTISKKSFLQTLPAEEKAQPKEEENTLSKKSFLQTVKDDVQPKGEGSEAGSGFESTLKSTKGSGHAMSEGLQDDMGSRFGRDFSNVRIHDNSTAASMNKEIGAKAFTNENDIYFNSGQFNENSDQGKELLAHELTHTIQQGASGDTVQPFTAEARTTTKESLPEPVNDGEAVKSDSKDYYEGHEDYDEDAPDSVGEMDEEDKENANNRDGDPEEKTKIEEAGVAEPQEDRSQTAAEKTKQQKEAIVAKNKEEQVVTPPDKKQEKKPQHRKLSAQDLAKQKADKAHEDALTVQEPPRVKDVVPPRMDKPVDADGEELPSDSQLNTTVDGLASMAQMFREHGREIKFRAAAQKKRSFASDEFLFKQQGELANNKEVTTKAQDQNQQRAEISAVSKPALKDSKEREEFVKTEAPKLNAEAKSGEEDAGQLVDETENQAEENKSNISDDPDAKADSEKQGAEMESGAEGSATIFDAILETIKATAQFALDADVAKKDNETSESEIAENDSQITMASQRIGELQAGNAKTEEQLTNLAFGPDQMRERAASLDDNGEEIIRASMVMEDELKDIQDKYYAGMSTVPGKEDAKKKLEEEQEKEEQMNEDQMEVMMLAGMEPEEQQSYVDTLPMGKKDILLAALESMVSYVEDKGTDDSEGRRMKVDTGLGKYLDTHAEDPRMAFAQEHEDERKRRLQLPLDIADRNMGVISEAQKAELADRLATDAYTEQMGNMVSWQMAGDMAQGMIDPRMALGGMVSGFEKMGSGLLNIVNWEAWEKDPLGNLLQIGADLSTGVARIAGGILSLGAVIQTLMVFINVITWGFGIPFTLPEMVWMGTVMSVSGWVALIAGSLSVLFNSLAYTKNLHDAATAPTAREFLGNVEQMKENSMDATEGLMSVVGGKGSQLLGKFFKKTGLMNKFKSTGLFKSIKGGMKGAKNVAFKTMQAIGKGFKSLFQGGAKAFKNFGTRLKKLFGKKKTDKTHNEIKKDSVSSQKSPDGHTYERMPDGQVAKCSNCSLTRKKYEAELNDPRNAQLKKDLDQLEMEMNKIPDGDVIPDDLLKRQTALEQHLDDIRTGKVEPKHPVNEMTDVDKPTLVCFAPGTLVKTTGGDVSIELIRTGDQVYSWSESSNAIEIRTVTEIFEGSTEKLLRIVIANETIFATWDHPFWSEDKQEWVEASMLRKGENLRMIDGTLIKVEEISLEITDSRTYNFEVEDNHNYFVGQNGVLVHNKKTTSYLTTANKKIPSEIYGIWDHLNQEYIYIGKASGTSTAKTRFEGDHRPNAHKKWAGTEYTNMDEILPGGKSKRFELKVIKKGMWNKFTTAILEQYFISQNGGKEKLLNKIRGLAQAKFDLIKDSLAKSGKTLSSIFDADGCTP